MTFGIFSNLDQPLLFGINNPFTTNLEYFLFVHYLSKYLDFVDTVRNPRVFALCLPEDLDPFEERLEQIIFASRLSPRLDPNDLGLHLVE